MTMTNLPTWRRLLAASAVGMLALAGCDGKKGAAAEGGEKKPASAEAAEGGEGHAHNHSEHGDEVKLTPEAVRQNRIRVEAVQRHKLASTISVPARVAYNAEAMSHVGSVVKGRIAEMKVRVGDTVKAGDVLAIVDSTDLGEAQSEYVQRATAAEIAKPAVALAEDAHKRAKELYEKNQGISLTDLQRRQGELQVAQGAVGTAKAALTAADTRLQLLGMTQEQIAQLAEGKKINPKYEVRAPIAGQVIEREATLGELVGPEKERLLTIADMSTAWVLADVPEAKLSQAVVGSSVKLTVPAVPDGAVEGKVTYVLPQLDPATRTARVRIEVKNEKAALKPGMFATADITSGEVGDGVLAVPEDAVQTVEGEPAVFIPVEKEPNTFATKQVAVGDAVSGMVPVFAGLKEGDKFVAAGSFILKAEIGKAGAAHEH